MKKWFVMDVDTGEVLFESENYEEVRDFVINSQYKFVKPWHVPFKVDNNCITVSM